MPSTLASSWAFAWIGSNSLIAEPPNQEMIVTLFQIWRQAENQEQTRFVRWALYVQKLLPRNTFDRDVWGDCNTFLQSVIENEESRDAKRCALVVAWYRRSPWTDAELAELVGNEIGRFESPTLTELLENLGEDGQRVLQRLKKDEAK